MSFSGEAGRATEGVRGVAGVTEALPPPATLADVRRSARRFLYSARDSFCFGISATFGKAGGGDVSLVAESAGSCLICQGRGDFMGLVPLSAL